MVAEPISFWESVRRHFLRRPPRDRIGVAWPSLPVAFMPHRVIEEPEAQYLEVEAPAHPRHGQIHMPAWMNPLSHLAAPDLGLGVSMCHEGWPRPSEGGSLHAEARFPYP
jgi:hypothetical protein